MTITAAPADAGVQAPPETGVEAGAEAGAEVGADRPLLRIPAPHARDCAVRDPMWFAYGAGVDEPTVPEWVWQQVPAKDDHVVPPPPRSTWEGALRALPRGTSGVLEEITYPAGRVPPGRVEDPLASALVATFGAQSYEPGGAYELHRGYASPRALYPVEVFIDDGRRWHLLDVARHALVEVVGSDHPQGARRLALVGRYTRLPRGYQWFRGSLVNAELGIVLRALCINLELFELTGRLRLPGPQSTDLLEELGLDPSQEWSLPLVIDIDGPPSTTGTTGRGRTDEAAEGQTTAAGPTRGPRSGGEVPGPEQRAGASDTSLVALVQANRQQAFDPAPVLLVPAVPAAAAATRTSGSWGELAWQRNSGRMPRGLRGMSGRRTVQPATVVDDALAWLAAGPPGEVLSAAAGLVTVSAVVQQVQGYVDGVHRVAGGGALVLQREDPTALRQLESTYGFPLAVDSGCDVRHASVVWFFSVRLRDLFTAWGATGWSAMQYACGWALHGLSLSATAAGMFSRPVRAFDEVASQRVLGLDPEHTIAMAAVVGTPRDAAGVLDIRL